MKHSWIIIVLIVGSTILGFIWINNRTESIETYSDSPNKPSLRPLYSGSVIPPNIAPLNFQILEPGQAFLVRIQAGQASPIDVYSKTGKILIPSKQWSRLLNQGKNQQLIFDVYVKNEEQVWTRYQPITNTIASDPIDNTLVYRRMKPIYNWWKDIGIYQRNIQTYQESLVLHGRSFGQGCLNCHSFTGNDPNSLSIGLRSTTYGSATLLADTDVTQKVGSKWGYTAWHPSGRLAVYSLNKVRQFFHRGGSEVRDVVDLDSALACYRKSSQITTIPPELSSKDHLETYPTWSPDGQFLYYCSGPILWQDRDTVPPKHYRQLKYDLKRVSYDLETDTWGTPETILSAQDTGLSILLPRISPDGKFLVFCMCDYGCFPIYQSSSDLYCLNLETLHYEKLNVNSDTSESWHSWSSNSRWIAFSSKRQGGLFTRTFLSYIDQTGKAHTPFVLPQQDPTHYDSLLDTYSVPELVQGKISVSKRRLARASRSVASVNPKLPITGASPKAESSHPWQERE